METGGRFRRIEPLVEGVLIGFAGLTVAIALILLVSIPLTLAGVAIERSVVALPITIVVQAVGFGLTAVWYLDHRSYDFSYLRIKWPTRSDLGWTVGGLAGLFALLILLNQLSEMLGISDPGEHEIVSIAESEPEVLLVLIPLAILFIGPGEEVLFRGLIQTRLVDAYGTWLGILATSLVFSLAHIPAYAGDGMVFALSVLVVLSLALGWLYEHTENLVVVALVHGLYDAILFAGLYVTLTADVTI